MNSLPGIDESVDASQVELAPPTLLTELEPRGRAFRESFAAVFRTPDPISDLGPPGNFWPDVFVNRRLPWSPFMQSAAFHTTAIALIWVLSIAWMRQHPLTARPKFDPSSVTYFSPRNICDRWILAKVACNPRRANRNLPAKRLSLCRGNRTIKRRRLSFPRTSSLRNRFAFKCRFVATDSTLGSNHCNFTGRKITYVACCRGSTAP